MKPLRLAVVGGGHLGTIHARLAATIDDVELVGVVEPSAASRAKLADTLGVATFANLADLPRPLDAAIVATPTATHAAVAGDLLRAGAHVLVEKPLTLTAADGAALVRLAAAHRRVLQVGHVERFNPAFTAVEGTLGPVKYVDAARTSGYTFRSTDVGVVHDLMIHDIDLVLALVAGDLVGVSALGVAVFGPHEDVAQARLTFSCGAVANLTASRTSFVRQRILQVFGERGYARLDLDTRQAQTVRPGDDVLTRTLDVHALSPERKQAARDDLFGTLLPKAEEVLPPVNAILDEQQDFVTSIRGGVSPRVTGRDGTRAVAVAEQILAAIAAHDWDGGAGVRVGPQALPTPALTRRAA